MAAGEESSVLDAASELDLDGEEGEKDGYTPGDEKESFNMQVSHNTENQVISWDTEELIVSQDTEELVMSQDTEEMSQDVDELVMSQDTEKLVVSQDGSTRPLYRSSSRCCKTKASIIISRSAFLAVGVAVLLVGVVLASTVRPNHNFTGDKNCSNCSLMMCDELPPDNSTLPVFPSQTTIGHVKTTPTPSSTAAARTPSNERTAIRVLSPTPTPSN